MLGHFERFYSLCVFVILLEKIVISPLTMVFVMLVYEKYKNHFVSSKKYLVFKLTIPNLMLDKIYGNNILSNFPQNLNNSFDCDETKNILDEIRARRQINEKNEKWVMLRSEENVVHSCK